MQYAGADGFHVELLVVCVGGGGCDSVADDDGSGRNECCDAIFVD